MRMLIAGGMGYIGSALVELYRSSTQHEIILLDRRMVPERVASLPNHARFFEGDIKDTDLMKHLLSDVDVLFLLAAEVEAETSAEREKLVWENNYDAPKNIIDCCPSSTRILFPSTGNVFGGVTKDEKWQDLTEEDKPKPKLPYAQTKVAIEDYLNGTRRNYVVVRLGTNYGYSPGIRFNLVTNNFVKRALLGQDLILQGRGENQRPTVCVNDSARALDFLCHKLEARGETFHVVQESMRIRDLAERVRARCMSGSRIQLLDSEVPFKGYALSSDKIKGVGFQFQWSLESAVAQMMKALGALQPGIKPGEAGRH